MNQKICSQCGTPNSPDLAFCTNCGLMMQANQPSLPNQPTALFTQAPPPGAAPATQSNFSARTVEHSAPKKSRLGIWLAILGAAGLLIIIIGGLGIFGLYYLSRDKTQIGSNDRNTNYNQRPLQTPNNSSPENKAISRNSNVFNNPNNPDNTLPPVKNDPDNQILPVLVQLIAKRGQLVEAANRNGLNEILDDSYTEYFADGKKENKKDFLNSLKPDKEFKSIDVENPVLKSGNDSAASVNCIEVFKYTDGAVSKYNSTYGFVNRNGTWLLSSWRGSELK
jgi:hypothetical protein